MNTVIATSTSKRVRGPVEMGEVRVTPKIVLVQRESDFWPTALSWLPGRLTTKMGGERTHAIHSHGIIKSVPATPVKQLPSCLGTPA